MEKTNKEYVSPTKAPTQWATAYPVPVGWMRQFRYFVNLFEMIINVPGDVVECGIGEGNTFAMLAYLIGSEGSNPPRILWGFDSFEGWPEPTPYDASPRNPKKGEWHVKQEMVDERLETSGIRREFPNLDIRMVRGFFNETLPKFPHQPIAFLHIDADLYVGYRDALEVLFPKVVKGGIVAFDEYREFPESYKGAEKWPGCTKAVDEYLAGSRQQIQYWEETRKYYIVKK